MDNLLILEVVGIFGAALLLWAYWLSASNKASFNSILINVLNLCGALAIAFNSALHLAWVPTALNGIWAAVALKALLNRKSMTPPESD